MAGLNIATALKPLRETVLFGDSRPAQSNSAPFRQSARSFIHNGNYRSGSRLTVVSNQGNSGDRIDQCLARLPAAIASGAGHMIFWDGVNDLAQALAGYTTVNTIGPWQNTPVTLANVHTVYADILKYIIQQFIGSGGRLFTMMMEPGAENLTAAQVVAWINLVQQQKEIADAYHSVDVFDIAKYLHDTAASGASSIRFKVGYAQEALGSGVHLEQLGAHVLGIPMEAYIRARFGESPFLPSSPAESRTASSQWNVLLNPLMIGTAGTAGAGWTAGQVPTGWTGNRSSGGSGTQTATAVIQAAADGSPGNEVAITPTWGAAGDGIRLQQAANPIGDIVVGEYIQGMCRVTVDAGGAVPLAGFHVDLQYNDGTTTFFAGGNVPLVNTALPTDGFTMDIRTPTIPATARTGGFCVLNFNLYGSGAGQGPVVRIKQAMLRKRSSPLGA